MHTIFRKQICNFALWKQKIWSKFVKTKVLLPAKIFRNNTNVMKKIFIDQLYTFFQNISVCWKKIDLWKFNNYVTPNRLSLVYVVVILKSFSMTCLWNDKIEKTCGAIELILLFFSCLLTLHRDNSIISYLKSRCSQISGIRDIFITSSCYW